MFRFIKSILRFNYWNTALAGTKFVTGFETILGFLDLSIISQALSVIIGKKSIGSFFDHFNASSVFFGT
jgi:hypothetical protein